MLSAKSESQAKWYSDILCWVPGLRDPHHLNFQGPQAKFEGSFHWNIYTNPPFFYLIFFFFFLGGGGGGGGGAQAKFHKGSPLDFQGPGALPPVLPTS